MSPRPRRKPATEAPRRRRAGRRRTRNRNARRGGRAPRAVLDLAQYRRGGLDELGHPEAKRALAYLFQIYFEW
jgi:hypothetical protein